MLSDLLPGDIMFAKHVSPRAADLLILAGQLTLGQPGYPHHVAVVTEAAGADRPYRDRPKIVQAMPHGAEEIEIGITYLTEGYTYVRPAYAFERVTNFQGDMVADAARKYIGTPYSYADYAAIAGLHFGIKNGPIRRYVTTSKHMICSQLADQALSDAGFHVFDDGRLPQDVTPSALYSKLLSLPGTRILIPGHVGWELAAH